MNSPTISVVFLTYNSDPVKVKLSLMSIVKQNYPQKELIISDDGSVTKDFFRVIEEFLNTYERNFKKVIFQKNPKNEGTVQNLRKARSYTSGELTAGLSPGDLFYDQNTLNEISEFYTQNDKPIFFSGLQRSYSYKNNEKKIKDINFMCPNLKEISILTNPILTFRKLLKGNFLSAASGFIYDAKFIGDEKYILPEGIKYLEDYPIVLLLSLLGYKIPILKKYVTWYEYGYGMSTSKKNSNWQLLLSKDLLTFIEYISSNLEVLIDINEIQNSKIIERSLNSWKKRYEKGKILSKFPNKFLKRTLGAMLFPRYALSALGDKFKAQIRIKEIVRERKELTKLNGEGFYSFIEEFLNNASKEEMKWKKDL